MHVCVCGFGQTDGATPLFVASEEGHVAVVEALVKAGATVDQATVCDCMPFSAAGRVCSRISLGDALERTSCEQWGQTCIYSFPYT